MNISILIVTNDFEKWIEDFKESFHNEKTIIQKHGNSFIIIYQQEKKLKLDFILLIKLQKIL